jgi:hypothetical protein
LTIENTPQFGTPKSLVVIGRTVLEVGVDWGMGVNEVAILRSEVHVFMRGEDVGITERVGSFPTHGGQGYMLGLHIFQTAWSAKKKIKG